MEMAHACHVPTTPRVRPEYRRAVQSTVSRPWPRADNRTSSAVPADDLGSPHLLRDFPDNRLSLETPPPTNHPYETESYAAEHVCHFAAAGPSGLELRSTASALETSAAQ